MRKIFFPNQRGDTIIEVMIATAIIAAVLGAAYAISSRSLAKGRISQERTEALKLTEGQIERLKYESKANAGFDGAYRVNDYCLSVNPATGLTQKNPNTLPSPYDTNCIKDFYKINITYEPDPDRTLFLGIFHAKTVWDRFGGGQEELVIDYQL